MNLASRRKLAIQVFLCENNRSKSAVVARRRSKSAFPLQFWRSDSSCLWCYRWLGGFLALLRVGCVRCYTATEGCMCIFCWKASDVMCCVRVRAALDEWYSETGLRSYLKLTTGKKCQATDLVVALGDSNTLPKFVQI